MIAPAILQSLIVHRLHQLPVDADCAREKKTELDFEAYTVLLNWNSSLWTLIFYYFFPHLLKQKFASEFASFWEQQKYILALKLGGLEALQQKQQEVTELALHEEKLMVALKDHLHKELIARTPTFLIWVLFICISAIILLQAIMRAEMNLLELLQFWLRFFSNWSE